MADPDPMTRKVEMVETIDPATGERVFRNRSADPDPIPALIAEKLARLEKALRCAYSGSAEDGSFIRGESGARYEYVPSVFMTLNQLRDALAALSAQLHAVTTAHEARERQIHAIILAHAIPGHSVVNGVIRGILRDLDAAREA